MRTIAILCLVGILSIGCIGCFGNTNAFIASGTGVGIAIGATPFTPNLVVLGGDFNLGIIDVDAAQEIVTIYDNTFYDLDLGAGVGEGGEGGTDTNATSGKRRGFYFGLSPVENAVE